MEGEHLSTITYRIDVDQSFFEDESALEALLIRGQVHFRSTKTPVHPKATSGRQELDDYLERVHLLREAELSLPRTDLLTEPYAKT